MKIYRIGMDKNPTADHLIKMKTVRYAHFSALGTWLSKKDPCKVCEWHWQDYTPPLIVQWEGSNSAIGDFSWDGPFGYLFIVNELVARALADMNFECHFLSTKIEHSIGKSISPSLTDNTKLLWGLCDSFVDLDMNLSQVELISSCEVCGNTRFTFRNKGIVINHTSWKGQKMFRVTTNGNSLATFVTEEGRDLIRQANFSNIAFSEAGEIVM